MTLYSLYTCCLLCLLPFPNQCLCSSEFSSQPLPLNIYICVCVCVCVCVSRPSYHSIQTTTDLFLKGWHSPSEEIPRILLSVNYRVQNSRISLSWTRSIQSTTSHPIPLANLRNITIQSTLRSSKKYNSFRFSYQNISLCNSNHNVK
jgi:hypothetical protein